MRNFTIRASNKGVDKKFNVIKATRLLTSYDLKSSKAVLDEVCDNPMHVVTLPLVNENNLYEARSYFEGAGVDFRVDPEPGSLYYDALRRLTKRAVDAGDLRAARILMDTMEQLS